MDDGAGLVIRNATQLDVEEVAGIHVSVMPGYLSRLSKRLLRLYYNNASKESGVIFKVATISGKIAGYYLATVEEAFSHGRVFARSPGRLAMELAISPISALIVASQLFAPRQTDRIEQYAWLIYIGVDTGMTGQGVGRALFADLVESMSKEGVSSFGLAVESGNRRAISFYDKLGGERIETTTRKDMELVWYRFEVEKRNTANEKPSY